MHERILSLPGASAAPDHHVRQSHDTSSCCSNKLYLHIHPSSQKPIIQVAHATRTQ